MMISRKSGPLLLFLLLWLQYCLAQDVDTCVTNLEAVSDDPNVTQDGYLEFLSLQSGGNLQYEEFSQLPLDLKLLFYTAACSGGRDCTAASPSISLESSGMASTLLNIFCKQVLQVIETPKETLKVSFRYVLRYKSDYTVEELLEQGDNSTILSDLSTATERVVKLALQCPNSERRRTQKRSDIHVSSYPNDTPTRLLLGTTKGELHLRGRRHLQECQYSVEAHVDNAFDYPCDPPPESSDVTCALVDSSVTLTPDGDELPDDERTELRSVIITALSDAVDNGTFEDHLP